MMHLKYVNTATEDPPSISEDSIREGYLLHGQSVHRQYKSLQLTAIVAEIIIYNGQEDSASPRWSCSGPEYPAKILDTRGRWPDELGSQANLTALHHEGFEVVQSQRTI